MALYVYVQHCVVTLEDADDDAEADESGEKPQYVVKILDLRYGGVVQLMSVVKHAYGSVI